jgi:hypothetical protein
MAATANWIGEFKLPGTRGGRVSAIILAEMAIGALSIEWHAVAARLEVARFRLPPLAVPATERTTLPIIGHAQRSLINIVAAIGGTTLARRCRSRLRTTQLSTPKISTAPRGVTRQYSTTQAPRLNTKTAGTSVP